MKEPGKLYNEIDEALEPLSLIMEIMTNISDQTPDGEFDNPVVVTEMDVSLPVELDIHVDDDGGITLASAPPTQHIETTFMPVLQNVRVKITTIDKLYGEE